MELKPPPTHHRLLTFAHYGEAQVFIEQLQLLPVKDGGHDDHYSLFSHNNIDLIILGEGMPDTLIKLTQYLQNRSLDSRPSLIINFGIAASLHSHYLHEQIFAIRTVYAENYFHSFHAENYPTDCPVADAISCHKRIQNTALHKELLAFAPLVERELWAIAKVAHAFKIPWWSFKMISDDGSAPVCTWAKDHARTFSQSLWDYSLKHSLLEIRDNLSCKENQESAQAIWEKFPWPTKKRKWLKRAEKTHADFMHQLWSESTNPDIFYAAVENCLYPTRQKCEKKFQSLVAEIKQKGIQVEYDQKFEKQGLTLKIPINSEKNIQDAIAGLKNFSYTPLEQFWQGKNLDDVFTDLH